MHPHNNPLTQLLENNPQLVAAWYDNPVLPTKIIAVDDGSQFVRTTSLPKELQHLPVIRQRRSPIRILRTPVTHHAPRNAHQACQDEPISAGTQIQPQGANWLGTGGAPVSWLDSQNTRHWGILSNWHVIADGDPRVGRPVHQPDTGRSPFAKLSAWKQPLESQTNRIDAAIADAEINGFHTITNRILEIDELGTKPVTATIGMSVLKSGRTTGLTHAKCLAVGASVKVSYGDFTATFEDQDIFASDKEPFSAPGDSGSMIIAAACRCPTSLLFAGSDELTVGNPIRHLTQAFNLVWPFN